MQEIELKITEGKSKSKTNHLDIVPNSVVRIFVNKDYTYFPFLPNIDIKAIMTHNMKNEIQELSDFLRKNK